MACAEASGGGGDGNGAQQLAFADPTAADDLRVWCLAAAVGIRDECRAGLLLLDREGDEGGEGADGGRCDDASGGRVSPRRRHEKPTTTGCGLAACGDPLVQLLGRQAACIAAQYELHLAPPGPARHTGGAPRADAVLSPVAGDEDQQQRQRLPYDGAGGGSVDQDKKRALVLKRLDDVLSIAYARFYAYLYKDLPLCWRQLYTDAAILKFSCLYLRMLPCVNNLGDVQQELPNGVRVKHAAPLPPPDNCHTMDEMVKTLDLALILAGAGGEARGRPWINKAFELLERMLAPTTQPSAVNVAHEPAINHTGPRKRAKLDPWSHQPSFSTHEPFIPPVAHPIRRVPAREMDMAAFQQYLDAAPRDLGPQPLVLTGLVDTWPARSARPWSKPAYLLERTLGGRRLVPVEIGRSYVDAGWGQKIVRFADFLTDYIVGPSANPSALAEENKGVAPTAAADNTPTAYLAQHQLLLQLPHLRNDILLPDLCYTAPPPHPTEPAQPELAEPTLNAWFGPPGTITPLHTDPFHNLLVQVAGRKYVRLYAPQESRGMRPRGKEGGVEMGNTSLLDVGVLEGWDRAEEEEEEEEGDDDGVGSGVAEEQRALFRAVPFVDCILEPGDTLYIPVGWWHYVRGLSVSFSVSIWWN